MSLGSAPSANCRRPLRVEIGLGAGLTFLLGAGLMALMFLSSRRGYDERAHEAERLVGERWRPPPADED